MLYLSHYIFVWSHLKSFVKGVRWKVLKKCWLVPFPSTMTRHPKRPLPPSLQWMGLSGLLKAHPALSRPRVPFRVGLVRKWQPESSNTFSTWFLKWLLAVLCKVHSKFLILNHLSPVIYCFLPRELKLMFVSN